MKLHKRGPQHLMAEIFLVPKPQTWGLIWKLFCLFASLLASINKFFLDFPSGGAKPNLADLAVYGVLRPIRYLKAGKDMVDNTKIGEWYQRMEIAVGESSRIAA